MEEKFPLRIETTRKSVHFYLDGILLHSIPNELAKYREYRYEGYNGFGHYDAYLRGNKLHITLKFLDNNNKQKTFKTHYIVPAKKVANVIRLVKQVAEE